LTEIILARHGETEWNVAEIFRGTIDVELNETGMKQADLLGRYLGTMKVEAVYSSPLNRALKTAEAIAGHQHLQVETVPALIDLDFGKWQGLTGQEVRDDYPEVYSEWLNHPEKVEFPDGENLNDVRERVVGLVNKLVHEHQGTFVLVSHRVVNKLLICALLGLDNSHFWNIHQDTCGVTVFSLANGRFVLTRHNDTSFLQRIAAPRPEELSGDNKSSKMKMNGLEKLFIRSPFRVFLLRKFEADKVLKGLDVSPDGVCLEIGCGLGAGTLLINRYLDCRQVIGVDIDPDMIDSANRYIYRPPGWADGINTHNIEFDCQDAAELSFPDGYFDTVVLFGVLDHIREWPRVINEVFRVLKPGGIFSFEEFLLGSSAEKRFGHVSITRLKLEEALTQAGFRISSFETGKLIPHCFVRAEKTGN